MRKAKIKRTFPLEHRVQKEERTPSCRETRVMDLGWEVEQNKQLWILVEELLMMKMRLRWTPESIYREVPQEITSPALNT